MKTTGRPMGANRAPTVATGSLGASRRQAGQHWPLGAPRWPQTRRQLESGSLRATIIGKLWAQTWPNIRPAWAQIGCWASERPAPNLRECNCDHCARCSLSQTALIIDERQLIWPLLLCSVQRPYSWPANDSQLASGGAHLAPVASLPPGLHQNPGKRWLPKHRGQPRGTEMTNETRSSCVIVVRLCCGAGVPLNSGHICIHRAKGRPLEPWLSRARA